MLQVTALAMGRLYAKLEADNALGQLLLPLLADLLTSSSRPVSTRSSTSSIAGLALAVGAAGAVSSGTSGGADSASAAAAGQASPAEVAGAVVCALEGMASVCVQRGRDQWLYEQALQLLMTMYREPGGVSSLAWPAHLCPANPVHPAPSFQLLALHDFAHCVRPAGFFVWRC